jgi:rhamnose transport system ATP-binding protein
MMGLADRVIVMKEGRMVEEFLRGQWSAEAIVGAATGARKEAA